MTFRRPSLSPLRFFVSRTPRRCLALVVALAIGVGAPATATAEPKSEEAKTRLADGLKLFNEEDFDGAVAEFTEGYAIEPDPIFLYTMGQAELNREDCPTAVKLFSRFIAADVPDAAKAAAREAMLLCAERMAAAGITPEIEEPIEEPEPMPEPLPPEPEPEPEKAKWYLDPVGDALVAVGVLGVGAGVGLVVGGTVLGNKPPAPTYAEHEDRNDRVKTLQIAGGVTAGVGGLLLMGGVVRWVLVSRKPVEAPTVGVLWGGGVAGLQLRGRF